MREQCAGLDIDVAGVVERHAVVGGRKPTAPGADLVDCACVVERVDAAQAIAAKAVRRGVECKGSVVGDGPPKESEIACGPGRRAVVDHRSGKILRVSAG